MRHPARILLPALLLCLVSATFGQSSHSVSRISGPVDARDLVPIPGSAHPLALRENDRGRLSAAKPLIGITLIFRRSAEQEIALDQLIADQQKPGSPDYHKWIKPEEFASRFGMSDADLSKVSDWLESQGLTVEAIPPSKNSLQFGGSVGQVEAALATELHVYQVDGEMHFANATAPSVPAALAPVVLGIRGLDDFRPRPDYPAARQVPQKKSESGLVGQPQFTSGDGSHFLTPGDFAVIYGISALNNSTFTGAGQSIAVIGQSQVDLTQIAAFQTATGQTLTPPTLLWAPNTGVPIVRQGDEFESEVDLEYSSGTARGATIIFVYAGNAGNVFDALQYAVQHDTAQVITMSYSACEAINSAVALTSFDAILQQSVTQGQTIMTASGDTGAAGCEPHTATAATRGLSVGYPASSMYVTGVGGTRFNETPGVTYWNAPALVSAIQYIPEVAWNDTNDPANQGQTLRTSGGGVSTVFAKPSWQAAAGVPQDGFRDVPDISFASSGLHDGYLFCSADTGTSGTDNFSCVNGTFGNSQGFLSVAYGTSLGTPSFAAAVAIMNQALGSAQGFLNPRLYQLYATAPTAFHDITSGTNIVPCTSGSPNCTGNVTNIGYSAGVGYDPVTGLGSLDIGNLVTALSSGTVKTTTSTALTVTPTTSAFGDAVAFTTTVTGAGGTPTGTVTFTSSHTGVSLGTGTLAAGSVTVNTTSLPSGTYTVIANYSGDGTFAGSASAATTVTVNPAAGATFTMSASAASVNLTSEGASGSVTLTVGPTGGFAGTVALSCAITAKTPAAAVPPTCSVNPSSIPSASGTATVTFGSIAPTAKPVGTQRASGTNEGWLATGGIAFAGALFFGFPRRRNWGGMLGLLLFALVAGGIGCGGAGSAPVTHTAGTTAGSYSAVVTGTSGAQSVTANVIVVVP